MRKKVGLIAILALVLVMLLAGTALAKSEYVGQIPAGVEPASCDLCHSTLPQLNAKGEAFAANHDYSVFTAAGENQDAEEATGEETTSLPETGVNFLPFIGGGIALVAAGVFTGLRRGKKVEE